MLYRVPSDWLSGISLPSSVSSNVRLVLEIGRVMSVPPTEISFLYQVPAVHQNLFVIVSQHTTEA